MISQRQGSREGDWPIRLPENGKRALNAALSLYLRAEIVEGKIARFGPIRADNSQIHAPS